MVRSKFPEDRQEDANELLVLLQQSIYHSGPLPTPSILAAYEKVVPGLANHIVERSDLEQQFRHKIIEKEHENFENTLKHNARSTYIGQFSALVLSLLSVGSGIYFISQDKDTTGLTALIAALVTAFIAGRVTNKPPKNKQENGKDEPLSPKSTN